MMIKSIPEQYRDMRKRAEKALEAAPVAAPRAVLGRLIRQRSSGPSRPKK